MYNKWKEITQCPTPSKDKVSKPDENRFNNTVQNHGIFLYKKLKHEPGSLARK